MPEQFEQQSTDDGNKPKKDWAVLALKAVRQEQIVLFCDFSKCVFIRLEGKIWQLRSQRVRDWLAKLFAETYPDEHLLLDREIDRVLNVLAGEAWDSAVKDVEEYQFWEFIESQPVLFLLIKLMENRDCESCTMTELLNKLCETAKEQKGSFKKGKWPRGPQRLGAIIREYRELLEQAGVLVEFTRTNCNRMIHIRRAVPLESSDSGEQPSSQDSSSLTACNSGSSRTGDDGDKKNTQQNELLAILRNGGI